MSGDRFRQPDHAEPHRMAEGAPDALNGYTRRSQELQPNWMRGELGTIGVDCGRGGDLNRFTHAILSSILLTISQMCSMYRRFSNGFVFCRWYCGTRLNQSSGSVNRKLTNASIIESRSIDRSGSQFGVSLAMTELRSSRRA